MIDRVSAALLERTYFHRLDAFRPLPGGGEEAVYQNLPCALSRSAMVSAPAPPEREGIMPEALYRLSLYTRPEKPLRLGDRLEVRDSLGRVFRGRASDSFSYPSHCITVAEIAEVLDSERPERPGDGEDSRETEGAP